MNIVKSRTIIATPPGWPIKEQLEMRKMTQKEFAARMDMSEKHISKLINGEVRLTPDVAVRLETILGIPAEFWNNLEALYQTKKQIAEEENAMDADIELAKKVPYAEMVNLGWIEAARKAVDRVKNLRRYFEVARLKVLKKLGMPNIAYRKLGRNDDSDFDYVLAAWIQKARLLAREIEVSPINLQKLSLYIPEIRQLTNEAPEVFCPKLEKMLADCGIAFVCLSHLKGSFLHGASFIDRDKIILALTVRGSYADKFWFSLFHELGHILKGHITKPEGLSPEDESEADMFARDILIPPEEYEKFTLSDNFTIDSVKDFSAKIGIDTGIVVGRLQKDAEINFNQLNELKKIYQLQ